MFHRLPIYSIAPKSQMWSVHIFHDQLCLVLKVEPTQQVHQSSTLPLAYDKAYRSKRQT